MSTKNIAASNLPGPNNIIRKVLPNGISVFVYENMSSPSVSLSGYLHSGGLHLPPEKLGLAPFAASALMKGTTTRSHQDIFWLLETEAASININSGLHTLSFGGMSLAEDLRLLLDILADSLQNPSFPQDQLNILHAQALTGLTMREQDTMQKANLLYNEIVFANHPYQHPADGYLETVSTFTREDVIAYHDSYIGPKDMVFIVVGSVKAEDVFSLVENAFGGWENPNQPEPIKVPDPEPLAEMVRRHHTLEGKTQTDIIMGTVGPGKSDAYRRAAVIANSILGSFGMMGRIGEAVRQQAGLAYYASSSLTGGIGPAEWYVSAGVNPENVDKAIELILVEMRRLVNEPVSAEELQDVQSNIIGATPLLFQSNHGIAAGIMGLIKYNRPLDYILTIKEKILETTVEDVLEASQHYLDPDKLAIVSCGP